MRLGPVIAAALVLSVSGPAYGQEWIEFASPEDRFTCNFPGQPKVAETTFTSQFGAELPARVYSAEVGQSHYSATVVDYSDIVSILTEQAKSCPDGAETCSAIFSGTESQARRSASPKAQARCSGVSGGPWQLMLTGMIGRS